jgi:hypothetical protein
MTSKLTTNKNETHAAINKMLAKKSWKLLDPFTGEPWQYPEIPRSCLPPNDIYPDMVTLRTAMETNWPPAKAKIIASARQAGPAQRGGS